MESYAAAYWRAAKCLIEKKCFDDRDRPAFTTFPIIFVYRQALELILKAILIEHHPMFSKKPELLLNSIDRGHKLPKKYLVDLRSVVDNAGVFDSGDPVVTITSQQWSHLENVLNEWQQNDPDGMAFRYSIDRKAKRPMTTQNSTFNMESFSKAMEEALEILAGLKRELDEIRYKDALQSEGS